MKKDLSYALTETIVRKFLKEFKGSPKRSLRNIVDIALHFSEGRFQKELFTVIQNMLQNKNSAYYTMIEDMVCDMDIDRLVGIGMNVGFNSCTRGAEKIRSIEADEGFNIPWSVSLVIDGEEYEENEEHFKRIIEEGHELGINTWMIGSNRAASDVIELASIFTDDAFIVFCRPEEITDDLLIEVKQVKNIMFAIECIEGVEDACCRLRKEGVLYSVFVIYDEEKAQRIIDGQLFSNIEDMRPMFAGVAADGNCSSETVQKVYDYICEMRNKQTYAMIPWDVLKDSEFIDSVISEDSCLAWFDEYGWLITYDDGYIMTELNVFEQPLKQILKSAFYK